MSAYDQFEYHTTGVDPRSERIAQLQRELEEMEAARYERWGMPPVSTSRRRERLFLLCVLLGLSVWLFSLFVAFR